jgi:hypothetical protein
MLVKINLCYILYFLPYKRQTAEGQTDSGKRKEHFTK